MTQAWTPTSDRTGTRTTEDPRAVKIKMRNYARKRRRRRNEPGSAYPTSIACGPRSSAIIDQALGVYPPAICDGDSEISPLVRNEG